MFPRAFLLLFFLALLFPLVSIISNLQKPPEQSEAQVKDEDSDAIYEAVVAWRVGHPGEGAVAKQLVIVDTTTTHDCLGNQKQCKAELRKGLDHVFGRKFGEEVLKDYLNKNTEEVPLSRTIPTDQPKVFVSLADIHEVFKTRLREGWEAFYEKYPSAPGYLSFSQVGYNMARDRAVVYSAISCGEPCGTGHFHFLKKESGKWVLVKNQMLWIS